jgi:phosphoribosylamine--glycine ligase
MRLLFLSRDFSGASLCRRLHEEGNDLRAYCAEPSFAHTLDGLIAKVESLESGLEWVGRDGLIVCDDTGFGERQDTLRAEGFRVVGGSAMGDRLEHDRLFAMQLFEQCGMQIPETHFFPTCGEAADFVRKNPAPWVIKHNGNAPKASCYVGEMPDGSDVIDILDALQAGCRNPDDAGKTPCQHCGTILQKRMFGREIGVARYFNGFDWVGPIELNIEHKRLFPGALGPNTAEMGTAMHYAENHSLFDATLAKLKPWLVEAGFRGNIDINCIINAEGIWPLEATARFGYPATQLQMAFHLSSWTDFLSALADGKPFDLEWRPGFGVVILIAAPPFPFGPSTDRRGSGVRGIPVRFRRELDPAELRHVHFEGVTFQNRSVPARHVICDDTGYVMHVTGHGPDPAAARMNALALAKEIVIPGMFYRHDIGEGADFIGL